ncbi:protein spartin [Diorhabda carinulata]|uniref:protein spartin n=1 Tax=Diorhabda carinulata TaxID=1163345 RepID=UPI0025A04EE6|nr:protein spartin [Diorhabda carinulata]
MLTNKKPNFSWEKTYSLIKNKHDEAFKAIDVAITLEEGENQTGAIEKYKEGIRLIDEALGVQVQCPENPDITWEKARVMIQKIKKTRAEVLTRINCIQTTNSANSSSLIEDPPSYDEAMSSSESESPKTYKDLATALQELSVDPNQKLQEEVVYTHENVRVYFISPNGEVLSTQQPETLTISLVQGTEPNAPKAVLQVGSWVYPLVPAVSPCYRTNYGAFILPDLNASEPGSSVGIILPSDADQEVFDLLESILHGIIGPSPTAEDIKEWRERRISEQREDYSTHISNKIVDGAHLVSRGIIRGAEKAGDFFNRTTPTIINKVQPATEPANVPPTLAKTIQVAETATNKAAKVTGFIAERVGAATVRLGQFLAPHIQKGGTKLLVKGFSMPEEEASDKVKSVLTVAAGAVEGFSTIYRGLETSAAVLGNSLKENTVKIVEHKYGYPASTLAGDTLSTVGNVYNISRNTKIITPKGFAKRTGTSLVYGYSTSRASTSYENGESSTKNTEKEEKSKDISEIKRK